MCNNIIIEGKRNNLICRACIVMKDIIVCHVCINMPFSTII